MKQLWFDTETSGLDPLKNALLTAYFAVVDDNLNVIDDLELFLIPPEGVYTYEAAALKVNGIDIQKHIMDPKTVTFDVGRDRLIAFLEKHKTPGKRIHYRPAGHNLNFDIGFIKQQLLPQAVYGKYIHYNSLDTLQALTFAQDCGILPSELGKLESLVDYFGIPKGTLHNAKTDVLANIEVYKAMKRLMQTSKSNMGGVTISADILKILED